MALAEFHHEVGFSETGRIDRVVQSLTKLSRADIRGIFEHGCVSLDGKPCLDSGFFVKAKSRVSVTYDPHRRYKENSQYQSRKFRIIHEDPYLLVVEKSAGVLTVPTLRREKENLAAALNIYLRRNPLAQSYASVVHRLDRDTSGLLVFGKNRNIAQKLKTQFESHKPLREYQAIVTGNLKNAKGTFRSYLATDEDFNQHSVPTPEKGRPPYREGGKPTHHSGGRSRHKTDDKTSREAAPKLAITHYEVIEFLQNATRVKVKLETGRRNQIRVHFSEAGHPVLGDLRYEPKLARHPGWKHPRLALHATKLGFIHPITGKHLFFESTAGIEFEQFLKSQRAKTK
jgi:23S rRNA pseudouridine1911/1915/1917 synthase